MDTSLYYISFGCTTCGVEVDNKNIITRTAPRLKKFKGQPIKNLQNWIQSINGTIKEIK